MGRPVGTGFPDPWATRSRFTSHERRFRVAVCVVRRCYSSLFGDLLDLIVGEVVRVDPGVVDAGEADRDGVSAGSGLVRGGDLSLLVVPVGFLALDADLSAALDGSELGGRDAHGAVEGSRGEGRYRNGEEEEGEKELGDGEHGCGAVWC